jgi:hypothetical protein
LDLGQKFVILKEVLPNLPSIYYEKIQEGGRNIAVTGQWKISSDGKIDLVLYWEDAGYGMVIQTTGKNFRETKAIAEIIKNNFDR